MSTQLRPGLDNLVVFTKISVIGMHSTHAQCLPGVATCAYAIVVVAFATCQPNSSPCFRPARKLLLSDSACTHYRLRWTNFTTHLFPHNVESLFFIHMNSMNVCNVVSDCSDMTFPCLYTICITYEHVLLLLFTYQALHIVN